LWLLPVAGLLPWLLSVTWRRLSVALLRLPRLPETRLLARLSVAWRRLSVSGLLRLWWLSVPGLGLLGLLPITTVLLRWLPVTRLLGLRRLTVTTLLRGLLAWITRRVAGRVVTTRGLIHAA
jgi:hypothetical protein